MLQPAFGQEVLLVDIFIRYEGDLRCEARHAPSGTTLTTDAPVDNQGKGASFSPTDLVATALGTCMLTTVGIVARRGGYNVDGLSMHVQKHMTKEPPRRIQRLPVSISVPVEVARALSADQKREIEHTAKTCPVALSIQESIEVPISFDW
jgi:putative redox protein